MPPMSANADIRAIDVGFPVDGFSVIGFSVTGFPVTEFSADGISVTRFLPPALR